MTTNEVDPSDEGLLPPLDDIERRGSEGQFKVGAHATVVCLTCGFAFPASSQGADDLRRVEGASDPSDMTAIIGVECPKCSTSGGLVVRYGPEASEQEADLLVALQRDV